MPNSVRSDANASTVLGLTTRQRLTIAAAKEISHRGGVDLTVSSVARAAGMTTGAVYSCFENREDLVAAALMHRIQERGANADVNLLKVAEEVFSIDPPDQMRLWDLAGRLSTPANTHERLLTLHTLVSARHSQVLRDRLLPTCQAIWTAIATHIEASQKAGVTRADLSAHEMASSWAAALLGVAPMAEMLWDNGRSPEIEVEQQAALFVIMQSFANDSLSVPVPIQHRSSAHEARRGGRRQGERDSETRRALLQAAMTAQDQLGSYEPKVADIAKAAGVTTGALYAEFGDRSGLLAEVHLERLRAIMGAPTNLYEYSAIVFATAPEDEAESVAFARRIVQPDVRIRRLQALEAFVDAAFIRRLHDQLLIRSDAVLQPLIDHIEPSQSAGQTRADLPASVIAWAWLGCSQGLSAWAFLATETIPPVAAARLYSVNSVLMRSFKVQPWRRLLTPDDLGLHD